MPEKPLLLLRGSTDTASVSIGAGRYLRGIMLAAGVAVVLWGGASALSTATHTLWGERGGAVAFGPVAALGAVSALDGSGMLSATSTPLVPSLLRIPALGIEAHVEAVSKKADGSMATPSSFKNVGWYMPGSKPGDPGNAVMAGHVNNALTTAGVFAHLSQIKNGDTIEVSDASGSTLTYVVRESVAYPVDAAPAAAIFTTEGPSQLVLITCEGQWDAPAHSFTKRLVVYARLVDAQ